MRFIEKNNKIIQLAIVFIFFVLATFFIKYYFKPFFVIVFLSILTKPIYNLLLKLGVKKQPSGILSVIIVNIILVTIVYYFTNSLVVKVFNLYINHQDGVNVLEINLKKIFHIDFNGLIDKIVTFITSNLKVGASITGESLISYIIGIVTTYFILIDKGKIMNLICKLIPIGIINSAKERIINIKDVIKIEVLLVFFSSILIILGFKVLRVPSSVFLGVICGILDILPYVGTIIVFIPIIIYNIIIKEYLIAIGLIALYILSQIIRQILEVKYLSSRLDIHPLVIMISIYVGAKIFGIIGILIGPMYCLIAKDIIYD